MRKSSFPRRLSGQLLRFSGLRALRSIEVDPEAFRNELAERHGVWVPNLARMSDVPIEKLDAIAAKLIRTAGHVALVQGAGFGLGGMVTLLPDTSLLVVITLRLMQRLWLLYGFREQDTDRRLEMWEATAAAAGVDYGKDLAEKQILERLAPRIAKVLAAKMGSEAAEKWAGRLIPLAGSAVGGAANYTFVRAWGRRVQRNLREQHLERRAAFREHETGGPPSATFGTGV